VTTGGEGGDGPDDIALSALEHYAYCHRQAALIHMESVWADSAATVRGDICHTAVDLPGLRRRSGVLVVRSLPVWSDHHHLRGVCDIVEFEGSTARPVEYKVGRHIPGGPAELQLAGQALCLIEAGFHVPEGAIYSVAERRRHTVIIDASALARVAVAATAIRAMIGATRLPAARNDSRCRRCSLRDDCLPELTDQRPRPTIDLFQPRPAGNWHD
jgi:CRISPR-associated exonuclease Cas4